jgi:hypothetical protein
MPNLSGPGVALGMNTCPTYPADQPTHAEIERMAHQEAHAQLNRIIDNQPALLS